MSNSIVWIPVQPFIPDPECCIVAASCCHRALSEWDLNGLELLDPRLVIVDWHTTPEITVEEIAHFSRLLPEIPIAVRVDEADTALCLALLDIENVDLLFHPVTEIALETLVRRSYRQKKSQQRIRKLEHFFSDTPCYIALQDPGCRYLDASPRYADDFGIRPGSSCPRKDHAANPLSFDGCALCPVRKTVSGKCAQSAEITLLDTRGNERYLVLRTAPLLDARGNVCKVISVGMDLTDVQDSQDHLSDLGIMISSISHSLKGLLTGMDGGLYLMDSGFKRDNPEDIEEGFEAIKHISGRIRSLVLDILYYAKDQSLVTERVSAVQFMEDIYTTLAPRMRVQGIRFLQAIDPIIGHFDADAAIFRTAMVNLLENALDACTSRTDGKHSRIEIAAYPSADDQDLLFEIRDNGIGMNEETRKKMFTIFFSSKGRNGTGLGMFIASRIVHQHGGTIRVESEPGRGTLFSIRMPRRRFRSAKPDAHA